jgi:malate permease and related proteins
LTIILPMSDMMANVMIISAAMPSAATTTMYAVQFDSKPELVSSITLITTLLSIVTIPITLNILT